MDPSSAQPESFIKTIVQTLSDFDMIRRKDAVLLGVSGGSDSMALACAFLSLKSTYGLRIGIAHLNHCLRGPESDRDQQFVREFADRHALVFHTRKEDVKKYAARHKLSLEEAGRDCRLSFLRTIADENSYNRIALGHHKDDNAEQILINLLRGSGPKGLSGILPKTRPLFIRPFIRVSKSDIHQFLASRHQGFMEDSSNQDTAFLRNRIRHQLIPLLEREYNPEIRETLNRLSNVIQQEDEWMQTEARSIFLSLKVSAEPDCITLSLPSFNALHHAVKRRVARLSIEAAKGNLKRISLGHIEDILSLARNAVPEKSLDLPDRIRVFITMGKISFKKEAVPLRALKRS